MPLVMEGPESVSPKLLVVEKTLKITVAFEISRKEILFPVLTSPLRKRKMKMASGMWEAAWRGIGATGVSLF
jgi:hypothetical protein